MGMIIMQLKRKIGLIAAGLITLSGVSIIEEIYVYGNEKNKSNIQLEEYEIKDLASILISRHLQRSLLKSKVLYLN